MDERPNKHVGNAGDEPIVVFSTLDGEKQMFTIEPGASIDIPFDDDEFAAHQALQAAPPVEQVAAATPLEQLADHLATMPPDQVVTASDLLAILRPDTMTADAPASPASPAAGA